MPEHPTNVIPFKRRLSWREREIIAYLQKREGRPLTQGEIDFNLEQAKAIHGDDLSG